MRFPLGRYLGLTPASAARVVPARGRPWPRKAAAVPARARPARSFRVVGFVRHEISRHMTHVERGIAQCRSRRMGSCRLGHSRGPADAGCHGCCDRVPRRGPSERRDAGGRCGDRDAELLAQRLDPSAAAVVDVARHRADGVRGAPGIALDQSPGGMCSTRKTVSRCSPTGVEDCIQEVGRHGRSEDALPFHHGRYQPPVLHAISVTAPRPAGASSSA